MSGFCEDIAILSDRRHEDEMSRTGYPVLEPWINF